MKRRTAAVLSVVTAMIGLAMVTGGSDDAESTGDFDIRLQEGAPCSELFAILKEIDVSSTGIPEMNEAMRAVGCYSIDSERIDSEPID